jgi:excisionase family DNA binding protein
MRNHSFFSKTDLGAIAKCLGGQIKQFCPGLKGAQIINEFRINYPLVASQLLGRPVTFDDLKNAYRAVAKQELTDSILLQRFDRYLRYAEVDPTWANRVKQAILQIPAKKARKVRTVQTPTVAPIAIPKPGKPERFVTASAIARLLNLSESAVYRFAKTGVIPSHRIGGTVRFLVSEVLTSIKKK